MLQVAEQSPSLNQRRTTKRKLEADAKKATRAIVRDGDKGSMYEAHVPPANLVGNDVDLVLDLQLQVQTLTLNISILMDEIAALRKGSPARNHPMVATDSATPFVGDVVSMNASRKTEQQELSSFVSHPLPSSGNEAEVVDLGDGQQLLTAPSNETYGPVNNPNPDKDKVVHIHGKQLPIAEVTLGNSAANDEDVVGRADAMTRIMKRRFGLSQREVFRLCKREYKRREDLCFRIHGMTMTEVRIMRMNRKSTSVDKPLIFAKGYDHLPWYVSASKCSSDYAAHIRFCESGMNWKAVKARSAQELAQPAKSQARAEARRKDLMRASNTVVGTAHKFKCAIEFATVSRHADALNQPPPPTRMQRLASSWDETTDGWKQSIDRIGRVLGMNPPDEGFDWGNKRHDAALQRIRVHNLRAIYEHDADPNEYNRKYPRLFRNLKRNDYTPRIAILNKSPRWFSMPDWPSEDRDNHDKRLAAMSYDLRRKGIASDEQVKVMEGLIATVYAPASDKVAKTDT